jgi:hypothetical protein
LQLGTLIRKLNAHLENIYNMDEKGFMLGEALKVKVIRRRGRKNPHYSQDGNCEMVHVIECISVAGMAIPPMYIYKGGKHVLGWHTGVQAKEQPTCAWSFKGWTDYELGLEWVGKNFEKFTAQV